MKYAILIESKNTRFAALDRIAQIINPSVDLETFSFDDIKMRDIISTVLCHLLSLDPLSSHITNAEDSLLTKMVKIMLNQILRKMVEQQ